MVYQRREHDQYGQRQACRAMTKVFYGWGAVAKVRVSGPLLELHPIVHDLERHTGRQISLVHVTSSSTIG